MIDKLKINTKIYNKKNILTVFLSIILISCSYGCSNLDIQTLNNNAAQLMASGDIDGAIARLESIQDLNPNFPQTNYNLGIAYKEKGDLDKSLHYLERAVELKPNFTQAQLSLAIVYEELSEKLLQNEIDKLEKEKPDSVKSEDDIKLTDEQKAKLINYYKKSIENYEVYLSGSTVPENKETINTKIKELKNNIEKFSSDNTETSVSSGTTNNETTE
ncbi:MAG: tetratricopeptide repeat protein [Cyanobacteriota bacterium]